MSGLVRASLHPVPSPSGSVGAYARAEAEIVEWLEEAEQEADAIVERAVSVARHDAARIRSEAMEYSATTVARAEREAAEMRQAAAEAVTRLLREARSEAERIRALAGAEARLIVADGRQGLLPPDTETRVPPPAPHPSPGPARALEQYPGRPPAAESARPPVAPARPPVAPARSPVPAARPPDRPERMARPPAERMARPAAPDPAPYLDGADDVTPTRRRWWLRPFGNWPAA